MFEAKFYLKADSGTIGPAISGKIKILQNIYGTVSVHFGICNEYLNEIFHI